jgi:hypothetical protein
MKKLTIHDVLLNRAESFKGELSGDAYDYTQCYSGSGCSFQDTKEYGWVSKLMNLILNSNFSYESQYFKACFGEGLWDDDEPETINKVLIDILKSREKYINAKYNNLVPEEINLEDFLREWKS